LCVSFKKNSTSIEKFKNLIIDKKVIQRTKETEWDFANSILYKMCKENFEHKKIDKIVGKIMLIGRVYAAAIERRKNKSEENNYFYIEKVAPKFKNSELDSHLKKLKLIDDLTEKDIPEILSLHGYLTNLIKELTEQDKRSFASKYLHFHLPHLFFIYDTRAVAALRKSKIKLSKEHKEQVKQNGYDKEYASFFYKSYQQKRIFEKENNKPIDIRHFDNILMEAMSGG